MKEYVNVVYDVFELNFFVLILCFRGEFDLKELVIYVEEEDWFVEEEVGDILFELYVSDMFEVFVERFSLLEKEDFVKKVEEESLYVVNKGKFKVIVSKMMSEEDNELDDKVDEMIKLIDFVELVKLEEIM